MVALIVGIFRGPAAIFNGRISRLIWLVSLCGGYSIVGAAEPESDSPTGSKWFVQAGGYVHYKSKDKYEGSPWFAGVEYHKPTNWLFGYAAFNNSFGQYSQYAYTGKYFHPSKKYPDFHLKLTGGIVHGYSEEHNRILPVRWEGEWGIAVVPGIGYKWDSISMDVALLSASGLLFLVGYEF